VPQIHLRSVSFRYRRQPAERPALRSVQLAVGDGVTGIVGPNGAGKTTLFGLLLGVFKPTEGEVRIDGRPPSAYLAEHPVGFVSEQPSLEAYLSVAEFLEGLSRLAGLSAEALPWDRFGLESIREARLGDLSLGQKRRVELTGALCGDPALLLLDEPTNGLDPLAIAWLREALTEHRRAGRAILVASHHLDELQRIADRLVVLKDGRVVGVWEREEVLSVHGSFDAFFQAVVPQQA
jgi:ABC-2 type transport system ATP-binding protein